MLKIGIAGARGLSAMTGFQSLPEVEVAALCDLNEELLDRESKKYGIKKPFGFLRICWLTTSTPW